MSKRVGFYLDWQGTNEHRYMARVAMAAVRRYMPSVEIVHLTTADSSPMREADTVVQVVATGHAWIRRAIVQAHAPLPILSLDVDVVMRHDVSELWDIQCDVAMPDIRDPYVRHTGGVWFCRCREYLTSWAGKASVFDPTDVRALLVALSKHVETWSGKVAWIDERRYERLPTKAGEDFGDASLVHYRGPRKRWFPGLV
jgi:hypothetical protein